MIDSTRQKVRESNIQKQAVMSFLADNGITDIKMSDNGFSVSKDKGATWSEMASTTYVGDTITNSKADILADQLPQIEKVYVDEETLTMFVTVSTPLAAALTTANCKVYNVNDGAAIALVSIARIDDYNFSVVTTEIGENKNVGVYYEK